MLFPSPLQLFGSCPVNDFIACKWTSTGLQLFLLPLFFETLRPHELTINQQCHFFHFSTIFYFSRGRVSLARLGIIKLGAMQIRSTNRCWRGSETRPSTTSALISATPSVRIPGGLTRPECSTGVLHRTCPPALS